VWRDDNELLQLLGVVHQGLPQQGDPNVNRHVAEPEQDYARVGQTVAKDEVSKVFVIRQDDALFTMSDREEFAVGQRMGIVDATSDDIVALIGEEHCQAERKPFVKKKPHRTGGAASSFGFDFASTNVCAYSKHALTSSIVNRG
jgi:hypothetical protein